MSSKLLEMGVGELSALMAVTAAFVIWRIGALPAAIEDLGLLRRWKSSGFLPLEHAWELTARRAQVVLQVLSVVVFVFVLAMSFDYVGTVHRIFSGVGGLDAAVRVLLAEHAAVVKDGAVVLVVATLTMLLGAWTIDLVLGSSKWLRRAAPQHSKAHTIPEDWRDAAAGLWEARIEMARDHWRETSEETAASLDEALDSGAWREQWSSWVLGVNHYSSAVSDSLREQEELEGRGSGSEHGR